MPYAVTAITLWIISFVIYVTCNKGLPRNCIRQQFRRYLIAAIIAAIPAAVTKTDILQPATLIATIIALLWIVTYPLLFHITKRKSGTEYDNQIDPAFGIYLYGWLQGIFAIVPGAQYFITVIELPLLLIPIAEWGYFPISGEIIDINDMKTLQQTDKNEVVEFLHSWKVCLAAIALIAAIIAFGWVNATTAFAMTACSWWQTAIAAATTLFITVYIWKPKRGLFTRTGIAVLYRSVKEYTAQNKKYRLHADERIKSLEVEPLAKPFKEPSTILFVLGESATRDYMSAFSNVKEDTTPWMKEMLKDKEHCIAFPNAYSCHVRTVQVLEKSFTEFNQYDGGEFFSSCSIVDIARKMGMRIHWYSNQGYVGDVDTPVTLVANTADVAKWTQQEKHIKKVPYDSILLDYLDEVDPKENNFVVLHLIGNHFNFVNRFPQEARVWGKAEEYDNLTEYKNSLHYTDDVIRQFYEYGRKHLNMQAMLYMSDHGCTPTNSRRRAPKDFVNSRIPMMMWMSDEYQATHPERTAALKENCNKYWTNDMLYELFCGVFDIKCNRFKEKNSIAHKEYCHTRETLTIMDGQIGLTEDK